MRQQPAIWGRPVRVVAESERDGRGPLAYVTEQGVRSPKYAQRGWCGWGERGRLEGATRAGWRRATGAEERMRRCTATRIFMPVWVDGGRGRDGWSERRF